jgi:hypothetical protein
MAALKEEQGVDYVKIFEDSLRRHLPNPSELQPVTTVGKFNIEFKNDHPETRELFDFILLRLADSGHIDGKPPNSFIINHYVNVNVTEKNEYVFVYGFEIRTRKGVVGGITYTIFRGNITTTEERRSRERRHLGEQYYVSIPSLFVNSDFTGRKLGSILIACVIIQCERLHCKYIQLDDMSSKELSKQGDNIYMNFGFVPLHTTSESFNSGIFTTTGGPEKQLDLISPTDTYRRFRHVFDMGGGTRKKRIRKTRKRKSKKYRR